MNLYKIEFLHASPKDTERGIKCLLLAEDDERVYEWIKSEPEIFGSTLYNSWDDNEKEGKSFDIYNDKYDIIGSETFKEKIIRLQGEMNDDDASYDDAYYGITYFGWSLLKESITADYSELIELKIIHTA